MDKDEATSSKKARIANSLKPDNSSVFEVWTLGICLVAGGMYTSWCRGLEAGLGSYMIAVFFIATAYICLLFSLAEISSGLPFAGGSYGIARVTLGVFPGYLIACFDSMESLLFVANAVVFMGNRISFASGTSENFQPLYWAILYGSCLCLQFLGGKVFWSVTVVVSTVSLLLAIVYFFGK